MDNIVMFVALVVAVIIGGAMFSAGRISVVDDCSNYGASVVGGIRIECNRAAQPAGEKP